MIKEVLYDPFGGIMEDSNPALRIPIGFAGGLHDRDLGFVRFGWRDYDTFTSRWTAPDPLGGEGGDPDWYGYCLDDPVNGNDPLGLFDLRFYDANGTLEVDGNESTQTFPASNNPAQGYDKFPDGTFPFEYHKEHPESDENGSYGKYGNFVFAVPGHKGMGIHSGRKNDRGFRHPTHGCIRTTDEGHKALWDLYQKGKIDSLEVNPDHKRK